MCGRLACLLNPVELQGACSYLNNKQLWCYPDWTETSLYKYVPFYNGPPTSTVPVLIDSEHCSDVNTNFALVPMHWGYIPTWKESYDNSFSSFNARLENLTQSDLFKPAVNGGYKCVVLADGFYEWSARGSKNKQPHFIYQEPYQSNDEDYVITQWNDVTGWNGKYMMKLAGIFNQIKLPSGQIRYTCSILTKESDNSMSWLHHRMPIVINSNKNIRMWLKKGSLSDTIECLENICKNKEKEDNYIFRFRVVSSYVNNVANNDEKCLQKYLGGKNRSLLDFYKPSTTKTSDKNIESKE